MPFHPTRRNRNIGTVRQGHGQNNRLVIPESTRSRLTWKERLGAHRHCTVDVNGKSVDFFVEETSGGCIHACSVDDVAHLLSKVPDSDWPGLRIVVLRQPTRKQRILDPAWGRLLYFAELGRAGRAPTASGPAILLEAVDLSVPLEWPTSLQPDMAEEFDRLQSDGHAVERVGRRYVLTLSRESVRATQLYRTIPHEIGHWADWLEKVETPCARGGHYDALSDAYFARPRAEREAYAHRYADGLRRRLEQEGAIPFLQIVARVGETTE